MQKPFGKFCKLVNNITMALFKKPTEAPQIPTTTTSTTSTTSEQTKPEPTQVPQPPQDSDRARRLAALGYR